eukprot:6177818-Pleurochrysis_carterae.AAC.3
MNSKRRQCPLVVVRYSDRSRQLSVALVVPSYLPADARERDIHLARQGSRSERGLIPSPQPQELLH